MNLYSVRDAVGGAFIPPFCLPSDELASREFIFCVNDPSHQFHRFYNDYSLYRIGSFDDKTGILEPTDGPVMVITGVIAFKTVVPVLSEEV